MSDFEPVRIGTRWALVWDDEAQDFYLERPDLAGTDDMPLYGMFLGGLQRLSGDEDFVEKIVEFVGEEVEKFKRERSA